MTAGGIRVGIVGASGYTGAELLRLSSQHPDFDVVVATGDSMAGRRAADLYPSLEVAYPDLVFSEFDPALVDGLDLVFLGLPHGASMDLAPSLVGNVGCVVDLSAAFRLKDPAAYPTFYGFEHTQLGLLEQAVFGLPELHRADLKGAALIATPGCHVTAATLALRPLVEAGLIETTGSGGVIGGGIGAQIFFFTIGVRGRMGFFKPWQVGRVGPEIGIRFPLGSFEPHVDLGGGYAALASFDPTVPTAVAIRGGYARANAGLDFYPVKVLSLGAEASFDFLGLTRPALTAAEVAAARTQNNSITDAQGTLLATKGAGFGASFALVGVIGIHL